jgi:hypothetical protein
MEPKYGISGELNIFSEIPCTKKKKLLGVTLIHT